MIRNIHTCYEVTLNKLDYRDTTWQCFKCFLGGKVYGYLPPKLDTLSAVSLLLLCAWLSRFLKVKLYIAVGYTGVVLVKFSNSIQTKILLFTYHLIKKNPPIFFRKVENSGCTVIFNVFFCENTVFLAFYHP